MNHPDGPGELREVRPTGTCRNFRAKRWKRLVAQGAKPGNSRRSRTYGPKPDGEVRRIPLGHGLFAIVDAADYEGLSKYKWFAVWRGRRVYAVCHIKGKTVSMHRMIMEAPDGLPVDHIDRNGVNNWRSNLRVCTPQQNLANRGPCSGSSSFVGVRRYHNKWAATIQHCGRRYYLGLYDNEIEAAKVRDRKAYELNGEYAFLNLPEELDRRTRRRLHPSPAPRQRKRPLAKKARRAPLKRGTPSES
jgi:hypothetical protein